MGNSHSYNVLVFLMKYVVGRPHTQCTHPNCSLSNFHCCYHKLNVIATLLLVMTKFGWMYVYKTTICLYMQDVQNDPDMSHDTRDLSTNNYKKKFIALIQGERSVHADLLKRYVCIIYLYIPMYIRVQYFHFYVLSVAAPILLCFAFLFAVGYACSI